MPTLPVATTVEDENDQDQQLDEHDTTAPQTMIRLKQELEMSTIPATLTFPNGDRYHSARIDLSVANSTWSFGLALDAEPMGRTEGDGRCWLALEDGRIGECRWVGHDEGYLRFVGIGMLEAAKAEVAGVLL